MPALQRKADSLEKEATAPGFWDSPRHAQSKMRDLAAVRGEFVTWTELAGNVANTAELLALAVEENDDALGAQLATELREQTKTVVSLEFELQLSGDYDVRPAILYVKQGAGGVDAQDWSEMLVRMYTRWAERRGYTVAWLEESPGEEAGIKSTTLKVTGHNAYGWLKTESGVHRLVRISPFDSSARRHTSFASLWAYPVVDETIEIEILDKDLRVDTYRASGAGGQHINKTDSAVRMTHLPTGIVVQCQNDRSQHKNRAAAMAMLKARLYEQELQKREEELRAGHQARTDIGWGHQIRSYVLQPYQMVKDLRTGVETSNTQAVLDGDLDDFMAAALAARVTGGGAASGGSG